MSFRKRIHAVLKSAALFSISLYQRYLSPYKGFCCAYRVYTGRRGCSAAGARAIRRFGVMAGLAVLRRRLFLCGVAYRRNAPPVKRPHIAQRGDCDPGCDLPCDATCGSGRSGFRMFDFLSCCDCGGCDWGDRKRKRGANEKYVYIPPRAGAK
ncbi:MAG: hypothetical protein K0S28_1419 [Paucimonas sp.]|jgi:putative component of membrane protein insertase Oxa1/YidC/SpoIIIJ protein YidD|nr:hypothetical protein [Paucimonas sp.]